MSDACLDSELDPVKAMAMSFPRMLSCLSQNFLVNMI